MVVGGLSLKSHLSVMYCLIANIISIGLFSFLKCFDTVFHYNGKSFQFLTFFFFENELLSIPDLRNPKMAIMMAGEG